MEALLLGIYAFFVWLIFIKLKWLPWNITSQVIVVIIPIVALSAMTCASPLAVLVASIRPPPPKITSASAQPSDAG